MYVSLTDKRLMATESLIMIMSINVYLYIYFSRPLMDVYLRSYCCEFEFQKKRWQQPLKKYVKQQSQIYLLKKSYSLLMFLILYICFSIFDQIMIAYLFFISGFIQGEMGLTYSE